MKTLRCFTLKRTAIAVTATHCFAQALVLYFAAWATIGQTAEPPKPGDHPKPARYYSAQRLSRGEKVPPLPASPFPELKVIPLDERSFAYDDTAVDYEKLRSQAGDAVPAATQSFDRGAALTALGDCASELLITPGSNTITLTIINATEGKVFDLFRTFALLGDSITNSFWLWVTNGSNGQSFTFPTRPCSPVYYILGCTNDTDGDLLSDAREILETKTSPTTNHSVNPFFTDLEMVNVLVNDPEQDCGNEQNTQNETAVIGFSNTVIAAWVDTNRGIPGHGLPDNTCSDLPAWYTTNVPENIGWSISQDGGRTFRDMGGLPLLSNVTYFVLTNFGTSEGFFVTNRTLGTASDPSFARDTNSGIVYLIANPRRPSVIYPAGQSSHHFVPLWRSTNNGASFEGPFNVARGITNRYLTEFADGPSLTVDNFPGTGQGTVYATFAVSGLGPAFCRSDPGGTNWTNTAALRGVPVVAPNHDLYLFVKPWLQPFVIYISTNQGTNFSAPIQTDIDFSDFQFALFRSVQASAEDYFLAYSGAGTFAVNPVSGHFYCVYVDKPTNGTSHPNIYFRQSTEGGTNWQAPIQVNVEPNGLPTDQWQPVLTVKPDGTQLFIAWYDRRDDPTNQSLIRTYGVFADLPVGSAVDFTNQFPISTTLFPPAFAGTNTIVGAYDPANPPYLHPDFGCIPGWFQGVYARFMGDYDRAFSDLSYVYYTWGDNRLWSTGATGTTRQQADVRCVRLPWP